MLSLFRRLPVFPVEPAVISVVALCAVVGLVSEFFLDLCRCLVGDLLPSSEKNDSRLPRFSGMSCDGLVAPLESIDHESSFGMALSPTDDAPLIAGLASEVCIRLRKEILSRFLDVVRRGSVGGA